MKRCKRWWCTLALLLLAGLGLGLLFSGRPGTAEPLGLLDPSYRPPAQRLSWFSRLVPVTPRWAWLWKLKDGMLGPRQTVNIQSSAFAMADISEPAVDRLALGRPDFADPNGIKLWVCSDADLNRLRQQLLRTPENEVLFSPRISAADRIAASLFSGSVVVANGCTNQVGLSLQVLTRVRRQALELTTIFALSETVTNSPAAATDPSTNPVLSVRTNLAIAARLLLAQGTGMFLLDTSPKQDHRHIGLILFAAVPKRR